MKKISIKYDLNIILQCIEPEAEFKEFERRLQFKLRLKYSWVHLKSYSLIQDLSRRSIETGFWRI